MNAVEAIKTGRLCKPKDLDVDWLALSGEQGCGLSRIPVEWLLMEWEIQEPEVRITRSQFLQTFGLVMTFPRFSSDVMPTEFALALAKELGLEPKP